MKIKDAKRYILSPIEPNKITPISQDKLNEARAEIIKDMFNYKNLTGQKYQKFVKNFIQYSAGIFDLNEVKVIYDCSLKSTEGYHMDDEKTIAFSNFLYSRPSYPEKFFDFLNTIVHEFTHANEINQKIYEYKKFTNENKDTVRNDISEALGIVGSYMFERQRNQMHHYAMSSYYLSPWELNARKTANEEMGKLLILAKKMLKEKTIPPTKENIDLLKHFWAQQQNNLKDEKYFQKSSKIYTANNNNSLKFTKECLQDLLDFIYKSKGKPNIDAIANMLPLFYDTKITNQAQLNGFYKYLLKQSVIAEDDDLSSIMLSYTLCLAITKPNNKSKEHFENTYKLTSILENKKFPGLMNKLQYEVIDFLIKQPYFTVDKEIVENEYKKYHQYCEFEKYFNEQKQKEKNEKENQKINNEILLEK